MKDDPRPYGEHIAADPRILAGKPVVRGTRIAVSLVLEELTQNPDIPELLAAHPDLNLTDVKACLAYAKALRLLLEYRDFRLVTSGAVVAGDLQKDLHAHGEPPLLIAGKRAFHNNRSGKLEASPERWLPAILARVGTQTP
jgi:uncharacterized protein (DUF433 family)